MLGSFEGEKPRILIYWAKGKGTWMPGFLEWGARTPWFRGDVGAETSKSLKFRALGSLRP